MASQGKRKRSFFFSCCKQHIPEQQRRAEVARTTRTNDTIGTFSPQSAHQQEDEEGQFLSQRQTHGVLARVTATSPFFPQRRPFIHDLPYSSHRRSKGKTCASQSPRDCHLSLVFESQFCLFRLSRCRTLGVQKERERHIDKSALTQHEWLRRGAARSVRYSEHVKHKHTHTGTLNTIPEGHNIDRCVVA